MKLHNSKGKIKYRVGTDSPHLSSKVSTCQVRIDQIEFYPDPILPITNSYRLKGNMVLGLGLFSDTFHNTSTPLWFGFGWSLLLLSRESVWLRVGGVVFHGVVFFGNYGVLVFT